MPQGIWQSEARQASMSVIPIAARKDTLILRASDDGGEAASVVDDEEEEVDSEYEAETLPLTPDAGQSVGNLQRQSAAPQLLEDAAL